METDTFVIRVEINIYAVCLWRGRRAAHSLCHYWISAKQEKVLITTLLIKEIAAETCPLCIQKKKWKNKLCKQEIKRAKWNSVFQL